MGSLREFKIVDDVAAGDRGAIEVTLTLEDGSSRWCFFMTPTALGSVGDWVPGTRVRFHHGAPPMIVVSEISDEIVGLVLRHLDEKGELLSSSRALDGAG